MSVGIPVGRGAPASAAVPVVAALVAAALVAWVVTIQRMDGMDAGPGTEPGALGWFLGSWVTMMAAMMFPSAAPMVAAVARVAAHPKGASKATGPVLAFVAGYLAVWTAFGLVAYAAYRLIGAHGPDALAWDRQGPLVAGAAVAAAGAYQLTPLKRACLSHCRSPFAFVMHHWRKGRAGALAMGIEHGSWCLGCCAGLMLVLLVVGVMSLTWMVLVAAVIFVEKVLPIGARTSIAFAFVLIGLGVGIAAAPDRVPLLEEPATSMPMSAPGSADPMDAPAPMDAPRPMDPSPSPA